MHRASFHFLVHFYLLFSFALTSITLQRAYSLIRGVIKSHGAHHPLKLEPREAGERPDLHAYAPLAVFLPPGAMQLGHDTTAAMESTVADGGYCSNLVGVQVWQLGEMPTHPHYWSSIPGEPSRRFPREEDSSEVLGGSTTPAVQRSSVERRSVFDGAWRPPNSSAAVGLSSSSSSSAGTAAADVSSHTEAEERGSSPQVFTPSRRVSVVGGEPLEA